MPTVSQPRKLFSLEDANRTLPLVSRIVEDIVRINLQMKGIHVEARKLVEEGASSRAEKLQDRLQELRYECGEYIDELDKIGCILKSPDTGLVDFPSQLEGRDVWLCWKLGEPAIQYWHELKTGFSGRQPVNGRF